MNITTLDTLKVGESGIITALYAEGSMRRRLLDIGATQSTPITCIQCSPSGDPVAFYIRGSVIALRLMDCKNICIRRTDGESHGIH